MMVIYGNLYENTKKQMRMRKYCENGSKQLNKH